MLFGLLNNVFMLGFSALTLIILSSRSKGAAAALRNRVILGVVYGGIAAAVIMNPIVVPPGATFDTRAGPTILAGFFGGPLPALIAAVIGAAARYSVGGSGAVGGAVSLFIYAAAGCAMAPFFTRNGRSPLKASQLPAIAMIGAIAVAPTFFIGQSVDVGLSIIGKAWWLLLLGNFAGVTLLGVALIEATRIIEARKHEVIAAETDRLAREVAGVGVFSIDFAASTVSWDAPTRAMIGAGVEASESAIETLLSALDRAGDPEIRRRLEAMAKSEAPLTTVIEVPFQDGPPKTLALNAAVVRTPGGGRRIVGACRDITRDLEQEQDLRLKSTALDRISHGIIIAIAGQGRPMIYVNPSFERISGYAAADVLGRACDFLQGPDTDPATVQAISDALRRHRPFSGVIKNYHKSGQPFWNRLSIAPFGGDSETPSHFIGVLEDITEIVDANLATERANRSLEAQSQLLSEQLQQLDKASEAKSQFLAHMSHELRTPLNAIIGFSELLSDQAFGPLGGDRYVSYARDIYSSGQHLLDVINDVLDMSRLEAGAFTPTLEIVDADAIIDASIQVVHGLAEQKGLRLIHEAPATPLLITCDERATKQILINLLSNAIKFSPPDAEIVVTQSPPTDDRDMASICVHDQGPGFPDYVLSNIGKPFLQSRNGLYAEVKGAGLGLAISHSLAVAMGGALDVRSEPGAGSFVSLNLPIPVPTDQAADQAAERSKHP